MRPRMDRKHSQRLAAWGLVIILFMGAYCVIHYTLAWVIFELLCAIALIGVCVLCE